MRGILEFIRVILIMLLLALIFQGILLGIYHLLGLSISLRGGIPALLAILIVIFVLYRNKFQFHGFYSGKRKERLPHRLTLILSVVAGLCLIVAPLIG
ncbi:MAG: hypothetical protein ABF651_00725 [Sporolactobacillus sp.]